LVIIDGIYMLEKGPETLAGIAHRKDLIIASPDIFECDESELNIKVPK